MKSIRESGLKITMEKSAGSGDVKHKFGGVPDGIAAGAPDCVNCGHPLHLFLQIDLADPAVGVAMAEAAMAYVFSCLNCDSYWAPLRYKIKDGMMETLAQEKGEAFGEFSPILSEMGITLSPLDKPFGNHDEKKHQFGGNPLWIQGEEGPRCSTCAEEMTFLAQVDSDYDLDIMFGDMGTLFAFVCAKDHEYATFMQCF